MFVKQYQKYVGILIISLMALSPISCSEGDSGGSSSIASTTSPTSSNYSCSPKKSCTYIATCEEAYWYLENCEGWEEYIDTNYDGVPCERALCGGH